MVKRSYYYPGYKIRVMVKDELWLRSLIFLVINHNDLTALQKSSWTHAERMIRHSEEQLFLHLVKHETSNVNFHMMQHIYVAEMNVQPVSTNMIYTINLS